MLDTFGLQCRNNDEEPKNQALLVCHWHDLSW